jgi:hypothetical protein
MYSEGKIGKKSSSGSVCSVHFRLLASHIMMPVLGFIILSNIYFGSLGFVKSCLNLPIALKQFFCLYI